MKEIVIGIKRGTSKKNSPFTILYTSSPFTDYDVTNFHCEGNQVKDTYIRDYVNVNVGDAIEYIYQPGFNNQAIVTGVNVIE